jgi:GLPGLI family protein
MHTKSKALLTISAFLFANANISFSQTQGKITYELIGSNSASIEMWFQPDSYLYEYKDRPGQTPPKQLKADTVKENAERLALQEKRKEAPKQQWFGKLGSPAITYSSFDNELKTYCLVDTQQFVSWQITNDTATISSLHCQKAKGYYNGAAYEAWYAPAIPVAVAPLQFRGLPGLLIQVTNLSNGISLAMTSLDWPSRQIVKIEPCSNGTTISKTEFQAIKYKQYQVYKAIKEGVQSENR